MTFLFALVAVGHTGQAGYQVCCSAVGATCPPTLLAVGPGSEMAGTPRGWQASGVWSLVCESGPRFDPSRSVTIATPMDPGLLLEPVDRLAAACFNAVCTLPPNMCLRTEGNRNRVVGCDQPLEDSDWRAAPSDDTNAVVLKRNKVLRASRSSSSPNRKSTATIRQVGRKPRTAVGTTGKLPGGVVAPMGGLTFEVPPEPPNPCIPNSALRVASNQQVDEGNEAVVANEIATALNKFRAAITINNCNAFAWAALGDTMMLQGRPAEAKQSLEIATRLMPHNFHAWTSLGKAAERMGDTVKAREAFRKATSINPGYPPASEGLRRVGG